MSLDIVNFVGGELTGVYCGREGGSLFGVSGNSWNKNCAKSIADVANVWFLKEKSTILEEMKEQMKFGNEAILTHWISQCSSYCTFISSSAGSSHEIYHHSSTK